MALTDDLRIAFRQFLMECTLKVEMAGAQIGDGKHCRVEINHRGVPLLTGSDMNEGFWEAVRIERASLEAEEDDLACVVFGVEARPGVAAAFMRDRLIEGLNEMDSTAVEDDSFKWIKEPTLDPTERIQRAIASVEIDWDLAETISKAKPGLLFIKSGVEVVALSTEDGGRS